VSSGYDSMNPPWVMAVATSVSEILRENIRLIAGLEKIRVGSFTAMVAVGYLWKMRHGKICSR
jgi:hypothetical protein